MSPWPGEQGTPDATQPGYEEPVFRPQVQCYCPRDPEGHLWNRDEGCPAEIVAQPPDGEEP